MRAVKVFDHFVEVGAVELAVREVEDFTVADVEQLAGGGKLGAAECGQFVVVARGASIASSSSGGQADDGGLDAALVVEQQRASEGASFVIGMGGYTEQFEHDGSMLIEARRLLGYIMTEACQTRPDPQ